MQPEVKDRIIEQQKVIAADREPGIVPGAQCFASYGCEFYEHCRKSKPAHWVYELFRTRMEAKEQLAASGIEDFTAIPDGYPIGEIQQHICRCTASGESFVSEGLRAELETIEKPVRFLVFETISPAIPRYAGTRPFEAVPFQWSLHRLEESGKLPHDEYLCGDTRDPRRELLESLLGAIGDEGSVIMYSTYEKKDLNGLAKTFPEHEPRIANVVGRLVDLCAIITRNVYYPGFGNSFSLKCVQPVLVPELGGYEGLAVQDGTMAGVAYLKMIDPRTPAHVAKQIRKDLLAYCGHDTLGTVRLYQKLLDVAR